MNKILAGLWLLLAIIITGENCTARATETGTPQNTATETDYNQITKQLAAIEKSLKNGTPSSATVSEYISTLSSTSSAINEDKKQVEQNLQFVEKRIEALGPVPENGTKELPTIAKKRTQFNKEASVLRARISEADILLTKIDELDSRIINYRNSVLLDVLLERQPPLLYPQNLFQANKLLITMSFDMIKSPLEWYKNLNTEAKDSVKSNILPVGLIVLLALLVGIYLRLFIMRNFGYRHNGDERLRYSRKVIAAFFVALAYGIIPASLIFAALIWIYSTKLLTYGFFGIVLNSFLYYSLYVIIIRALARVTLAPYNEKWRLVPISTEKAKKLISVFYFFITVIGFCAFMEHVARKAGYETDLICYIMTISNLVKGLSLIMIIKACLWDDIKAVDDEDENPDISEDEPVSINVKITFLTALFSTGVFSLSLFGYAQLSAFIFNRFIGSCIIIGFFIMLRKAVTEALHRILFLRFWGKTFKLRRRLISKVDFWLMLVADPLFIIITILILLSIWGVSTDLLLQSCKKILFGFNVGGVEISIISIILGILVFFVTLGVVKALRRRFVANVLDKMEIDEGIKHSMASGISFVGVIIAALLAILVMGGNLNNLALIAGALSVGIGLGLQDIVNNFVSGIILLFERPVKVGDWVKIAGEEGKIKQINIRTTEVETFNRASVIVPNATLLSNSLTNLTHGNNWARYGIKVGVAYGTDVEKVKNILLECAYAHKKVLKKPEPYVLFQDFGSSSLDFELRVYVSDIWNGWTTPSDIRYEINRRFKEEGIEIPFAQMVIHQGSVVSEETESQFYAARKKTKKGAEKIKHAD